MSMRNAIPKMILPAILVAATFSTGCTDEVKRLQAANARLSQENEGLLSRNDQLTVERDRMRADMDQRENLTDEQKAKIAGLEEANEVLVQGLEKLRADYRKLANLPRRRLPAELNTALQEFAAANPGIAEYDIENGMVKFKSDLTFPPGGAEPNVEASAMLTKLVPILNSPEAKDLAIYVAGHTDDMPIGRPGTRKRHPDNWYLSVHRAVGIEKDLIKAGLDPKRICVMGFGEYHPVESNKPGKKGNPANRRVEIWIVPTGSFLTGTISPQKIDTNAAK